MRLSDSFDIVCGGQWNGKRYDRRGTLMLIEARITGGSEIERASARSLYYNVNVTCYFGFFLLNECYIIIFNRTVRN